MRYQALVTDYDGVIANDGRPSNVAVNAIRRLRSSGRRVILITGRRLEDLTAVFPQLDLFDCVVVENGGVVFEPETHKETSLGKPPPAEFVERLKQLKVEPLDVGRVIVSTWLPHHTTVLKAIQELGLELQVIFNRAAVMVLPPGVNKATGMDYALRKLGLSRHEVVGIGDSENDHSFLERSECATTVASAVPSILQAAALVTKRANGEGLAELVDELLADDLSRMHCAPSQPTIALGRRADGSDAAIAPFGMNILIAGPSGSGKSTVAAGIVERLVRQEYQLCIVDSEGDYGSLPDVVTIGNQQHAVTVSEVLALLEDPKLTLNVNLLGIPLADRPEFFGRLFPNLQALRARTGRPHWIVLDEAHHMLPGDRVRFDPATLSSLGEMVLVTVHPNHLAPQLLGLVDVVIAVGPAPQKTTKKFADAIGQPLHWPSGLSNGRDQAVVWFPRRDDPPFSIEVLPGSAERIRHHRKYAEGNMRERSFFFRGPENRLNLKAQNLAVFVQIAEGIDEASWLFHLRRGDYSRWFRRAVNDSYLADQAERIEQRSDLHPAETQKLIRNLIEARYTLPD